MPGNDELCRRLALIGTEPDARIDIAEAALTFASFDHPRVELDRYREHLAALASDIAAAGADLVGAAERAAALARVLAGTHGYLGDELTYDDPRNANLIGVIDRRKGLPVALGILYLHCARGQGWDIAGLSFPGHFLLHLRAAGDRVVIDPFHGGRTLETAQLRRLLRQIAGPSAELGPAHYASVGARQVLLRLQNNIKTRALQAGDIARAIAVVQRMALVAPAAAALHYELGLLQIEAGNLRAAITSLETCLAMSEDPNARQTVATVLQRLRRRLN